MSEQEPGAVEQWILEHGDLCTTMLLDFAHAHDAEDARRKEEFAAMHAEAARLAGRLIEREEYIDEREALLARLTDLETCSRREVAD